MKKIAVLVLVGLLSLAAAPAVRAMTSAEVAQITEQLLQNNGGKLQIQSVQNVVNALGMGLQTVIEHQEAGQLTDTDEKILTLVTETCPKILNGMKTGYKNAPQSLHNATKQLVDLLYKNQDQYQLPKGQAHKYAQLTALVYVLSLAAQEEPTYDAKGQITSGLSMPVYYFNQLVLEISEEMENLVDVQQISDGLNSLLQGLETGI